MSGSHALPPRLLPQCSCVVIESSFDPGERLQAPGSLWFSPIIILFLQYSHKCSWNVTHTAYRVWCSIFYSKLVNYILLRSLFIFVKGRGTCGCGSGERNVKICIDFRKSPRFFLTLSLCQEREKSSRPDFTMCGEPCICMLKNC